MVTLATNKELVRLKPLALQLYLGQRLEGVSQRESALAGLIVRAVRLGQIEPAWIGYKQPTQQEPQRNVFNQLWDQLKEIIS